VLALYLAVVTLGALRVCWIGHTHNGLAAPDCPMHHDVPAGPGASAHHHHGEAGPASGAGTRITCRCSGDLSSIDVGPIALLPPHDPMFPAGHAWIAAPAYASAVPDPLLTTLSPPPRSVFSA